MKLLVYWLGLSQNIRRRNTLFIFIYLASRGEYALSNHKNMGFDLIYNVVYVPYK